jgi:hypothetical protein
MKRFVLGVMVVLSGVAALPLGASASNSASPATLRNYVCQTAKMQTQRAMSITAVMGHVDGTSQLQMRFQLVKRVKRHGPSTKVSGRGLNNWLTPPPPKPPAAVLGTQPRDTWVVKKPVVGLAAPAYYRFNVAFRWLDAQGQVIDTALRHSRVCFQPQLQPNLTLKQAGESAKYPGTYWATIKNTGPAPSSQYTVQVAAADDDQQLAGSNWLGPVPRSGVNTVWLRGQPCTSGEINVTLTPKDVTDDASAADNMLTVPCPSTTATPARAHRGR